MAQPQAPDPKEQDVARWFTPRRKLDRKVEAAGTASGIDDVARWLLGPGRALRQTSDLLHELSWRLCAAGIPLARTTFHIGTLHPQFVGLFCRWQRTTGETEEASIAHGVRETKAYLNSPMRLVFEGQTVRRRLQAPAAAAEFPILAELRAEGVTDYLATPLTFSDGRLAAATWSTDRAGGFSDEDIARIEALLPALALLLEVQAVRLISANLLGVYLGQQTGQRVLAGDITRGSGETIRAVLLFADLRGFTALSDRLPATQVIDILNGYFERVVKPIHARGGEVLKFIGDGLLAIFPIEDAAFAFTAARRALEAALEGFSDLEAFNAHPARGEESPIRMAIALHIGDVVYGNIGGQDRLDFTTIGPAVNLVARLQQLSKRVERPLLLSDAFAQVCERPLVSLGFHPLRGLSDPVEVFTLRDADELGLK
ncbi:MAG TPA: adenylate/guanylate cyclase domain-containing protein [Alphaproteobacteria bacterium]|nr:adenylate/guanylate cyclase domain-containing protein [Alphaproteobacteria bacterium]